MDVYRNGERWLDDFGYLEVTPFTDWPTGERFSLEFTWPDAPDNSNPFFTESITLRPGERYYLATIGDPLDKSGQPSFRLILRGGALERSPVQNPPMIAFQSLTASPDVPPYTLYIRGWESPETGGERLEEIPFLSFGDMFEGYDLSPAFQFEADMREENGSIVASTIANFLGIGGNSMITVTSGFIHPPRPGDAPFEPGMSVLPDGRTFHHIPNYTRVQFIHNSPYQEADSIDVRVTRLDEYGPDEIVMQLDDLAFREASSFLDLPAGLLVSGERVTAPELVFDVISSDGVDTLLTKRLRLQTEQTHVIVLAGDPLQRAGQQPMDLFVNDQGREKASDSITTEVSFFNGASDVITTGIGLEGGGAPFSAGLPFGSFTSYERFPSGNDTLYVSDAETHEVLGLFETSLQGTGGSARVILVSGFEKPPPGIAARNSELELIAATPSGGKLTVLAKRRPPPWWQQPFYYVVGLAALAVAIALGSQLRLRRLEARSKELEATVEERTRELRAEKEKTEKQARRLVELDEAKNRFFANISHEFRTPLTLVLGPLQDAIDGAYGAVSPKLNRQHILMRRNTRRLLRLVNQLLDLSKLESGKMELHQQPGDIVAFLRELVRVFTPMAERRRVSLRLDATTKSLPTRYDPDALEKVFANLISNALKFTPEGGSVVLNVAVIPTESPMATEEGSFSPLRLVRDDNSLETTAVISVIDTGPGIPDEHLERIFERFQQGDTSIRRTHEGSGIGLTLARELAELHGGSLKAESIVGEGSTFTVTLPIESVDEQLAPDLRSVATAILEEPLIAPQEDGLPETTLSAGPDAPLILIVEDNADVREYLRSHLGSNYRLVEAEDGEAGLAATREHRPDLIISDIMMPRMDGYEMCRLIKKNEDLRHIPVIMLTAKAGEHDTVEGLQSGADDYMAKPFSVTELEARVGNFISSRRLLREKYSHEIIVKPGDIEIAPEEEVFLDSVLEAVNSHLADSNYTVDWLADDIGLSRRQLERRVQAVTGQSPADLVRNLRLQRASQLLRAHAGTVAEIAYSVGFTSPKHFSTAFSKQFGESPTAYATHRSSE